ncbi:MAG TPA: asparagine synthase (glutamine-hydrolyzing) [Steroidobacter sp.]|uniref:asparagine synthase (glutamine-hydrolyzing) n=1 Tax=Steroidobacter sp. TaxID=1978227 RepID=UPI002ED861CE
MCGLVGVFYRDQACDPARLKAMRDIISHRGPDDAGDFIEGPLGLGHRRLSIIDLSPAGHQPMFTADGRYVIVYNGEIYNYNELKQELAAQGAQFRSTSDTEVILALHARLGDAAVAKLNGIFAYALWDKVEKRLLLARDRAGIKPLYYAATPRGVVFGSEIKTLFQSELVTPRLNEKRVAEYLLFRQVAGSENLFADVHVVPPGHTMEIVAGVASPPREYWSVRTPPAPFKGSYNEAVDELDHVLNRSVARQLMSDVPLGTFCSGGIDSSLTTAIAARHAGRAINTFSVGFHEAAYDESEYARMAAQACGTNHHELRIDERDFAGLLPKLVWHHDLPLNYANSVHIYAISELARKHVTVVLTGEGADELFGGYPRYYIPRLLQTINRVPALLRTPAVAMLARSGDHRLRKLADFARRPVHDAMIYNTTGTDPSMVRKVARANGAIPLEFREERLADAHTRGLDVVTALATLDFQTYLVSILNRQDKMSMATSIESRVPFLDNEMIDFARSLPLPYKQTLKHRKRVLKDVALRYLPGPIIHRRKSGFGVPLQPWFASNGPVGKLLEEALHSPAIESALDARLLTDLLSQHRSGAADHSELLWGVLNLSLWREAYRV